MSKARKDPGNRAANSVRATTNGLLLGRWKTSVIVGCNTEELRAHVESQFLPGMSWENYGDWELDHIVSLSSAYQHGSEAFKKAGHYTNLQPLWRADNRRKKG